MTTVATVTLRTLRCIRESDRAGTSHSEPYIWAALASAASNPLSFESTPQAGILADARYVIKSEMRAGESAAIPYPLNTLIASFADGQTDRQMVLVVALWEQDDTPMAAVHAGYQAFLTELHAALGSNLLSLKAADASGRAIIIDAIKKRVYDKVYAAERDHLSDWEKTQVYFGWLNLDDFMGTDYKLFENVAQGTFVLRVKGAAGDLIVGNIFSNQPTAVNPPVEYEVEGNLEVAIVDADPCQAQLDSVAAAQAAIESLQRLVVELQEHLHLAPPQLTAAILAEIDDVRTHQIPAAQARLERARNTLRRCQLLSSTTPDEPGDANER